MEVQYHSLPTQTQCVTITHNAYWEPSHILNILEYHRDDYLISTDKTRLNVDLIHEYLSHHSYWAQGRPLALIQKSIQHSLCFGVYQGTRQVGFARVVTDRATFAWLTDLFILESHQGQSLGKWLVKCVIAHPELCDLRLFILATRDAHELYRRYGDFEAVQDPGRLMVRARGD